MCMSTSCFKVVFPHWIKLFMFHIYWLILFAIILFELLHNSQFYFFLFVTLIKQVDDESLYLMVALLKLFIDVDILHVIKKANIPMLSRMRLFYLLLTNFIGHHNINKLRLNTIELKELPNCIIFLGYFINRDMHFLILFHFTANFILHFPSIPFKLYFL